MPAIGIDLGTTNTVVAAVRDGRASALKDKLGHSLIPSCVSFPAQGAPIVGHGAKELLKSDPRNTVFSVKRLIGRPWDSAAVQSARPKFAFELVEGPGKSTLVRARNANYTLPEISGFVLEAARNLASTRLGETIYDAVITVPANFNDLQRAATKSAAQQAGLEVLRILNEPTAAALAYGFGKKGRERIAVYDFGGGTFDVTILELSENVFEVIATSGDTFLGGDDIDGAIVDRMLEQLSKERLISGRVDSQLREALRRQAEALKWDLSSRSSATASLNSNTLGPDFNFNYDFSLRRSEFEQLAESLVNRTLEVCKSALEQAGLTAKDLDEVLLVGGSTRIPLVRRRISSFFGKMPQSRINPDEVVAIGAAIQAMALETQGPSAGVQVERPAPRSVTQGFTQSARPGAAPGRGRSTLLGVGEPDPSSYAGSADPRLRSTRPLELVSEDLPPKAPPKTAEGSVVFDLADLEADLPSIPEEAGLPAIPNPSRAPSSVPALPARPNPLRSKAPRPDVPGLPLPANRSGGAAPLPSVKPKSPYQTSNPELPALRDPSVGLPAPREGQVGLPARAAPGLPEVRQAGLPVPANVTGLPQKAPGHILPEVRRDREVEASLPVVEEILDDDEFDIVEARKSVRPEAIPDFSHDSQIFTMSGDGIRPAPDLEAPRPAYGRSASPVPPPPLAPRSPLPSADEGNALAPFSQVLPYVPGEDQVIVGYGKTPLLLDVTPLSLGVEVVGGFTDRLIERNSPIPCEKTATFSTSVDGQTQVRVRVCQGEERTFETNTVLGEVLLSGLPPAARGQTRIDISFLLDENGMLQVRAQNKATGAVANAVLRLVGIAENGRANG
jgi:molecular chaperone DnaK